MADLFSIVAILVKKKVSLLCGTEILRVPVQQSLELGQLVKKVLSTCHSSNANGVKRLYEWHEGGFVRVLRGSRRAWRKAVGGSEGQETCLEDFSCHA